MAQTRPKCFKIIPVHFEVKHLAHFCRSDTFSHGNSSSRNSQKYGYKNIFTLDFICNCNTKHWKWHFKKSSLQNLEANKPVVPSEILTCSNIFTSKMFVYDCAIVCNRTLNGLNSALPLLQTIYVLWAVAYWNYLFGTVLLYSTISCNNRW